MASEVKLGIIGCGQVSRVGHGPAIATDERARIAAIADPDDENRAKFSRMFRVPAAYPDHQYPKVIQAGHSKRFETGFQRIKQIIDSGVLGDVYQMSIDWHYYIPDFESGWLRDGLHLRRAGQDRL